MTDESPATEAFPFHDRLSQAPTADGGMREVWCRAKPLAADQVTPWVASLPVVGPGEPPPRHPAP